MFKINVQKIDNAFRVKCGLSLNEYAVIDCIHSYQSSPDFGGRIDGWCDMSMRDISELVGLGASSVCDILSKCVKLGIIRVIGNKRKTTEPWNLHYSISDKAPAPPYISDGDEKIESGPMSYIYMMVNNRNGLIKIGKSIKPEARERTLQSEEPDVSMIFVSPLCLSSIERDLHKKFSEKRVRGEWFNLTSDDVMFIKKYFEV